MLGNKHASEWEGAVTSIPSKPAAFPVALYHQLESPGAP